MGFDTLEAMTLIAREKNRGIDAEKIVIAGFSMGGAIAINTAGRLNTMVVGP